MPEHTRYDIGRPGEVWNEAERSEWLDRQTKKRDYFNDVVSVLARDTNGEVFQYGALDYRKYGAAKYPLFAVKSKNWDASRALVVVTGGVHGYETSGIHGALLFVREKLAAYSADLNVLVLPCVSPWGYETINRWNPEAIDPNRQFLPTEPGCQEASNAMACILMHVQQSAGLWMHVDLHETTDSDNSEFTPAKAARDGEPVPEWYEIPDGFYLIGDIERPEVEWHQAMIDAVAKVTHLSPADEKNQIIGMDITKPAIIIAECADLGVCGAHTSAVFTTTSEVYPDSSKTTPEECNRAQVACVSAGIDYVLAHKPEAKKRITRR